jgi:hypothetical protein
MRCAQVNPVQELVEAARIDSPNSLGVARYRAKPVNRDRLISVLQK